MPVIRDKDCVRLISLGAYDWADRFPLIVAGAPKLPEMHFVIDGEVVILNEDGTSNFDALSSRRLETRAQFYAFDMLSGDGKNISTLPLSLRKACLAQLLPDPVDGIFIAEYEKGEIRDVLFASPATCAFFNGPVCVNPSFRLRRLTALSTRWVRGRYPISRGLTRRIHGQGV
jgi:bifunctional non-homologous end joining protein LigD